jgi:hypothetical protein
MSDTTTNTSQSEAPEPTSEATAHPTTTESSEEDESSGGAFNPVTGEINWDCPCLGGMAHGPCGPQFREAFSCFVFSEKEPKGIDCVEKFKGMQDCFREHPDVYAQGALWYLMFPMVYLIHFWDRPQKSWMTTRTKMKMKTKLMQLVRATHLLSSLKQFRQQKQHTMVRHKLSHHRHPIDLARGMHIHLTPYLRHLIYYIHISPLYTTTYFISSNILTRHAEPIRADTIHDTWRKQRMQECARLQWTSLGPS